MIKYNISDWNKTHSVVYKVINIFSSLTNDSWTQSFESSNITSIILQDEYFYFLCDEYMLILMFVYFHEYLSTPLT